MNEQAFSKKADLPDNIAKHWQPFSSQRISELYKVDIQFSSQELFLSSGADPNNYVAEALYWGSRGIGKTEAMLVAYAMHIGKGYVKWDGLILRKEYKSLNDIIQKSKVLFEHFFGDQAIWHNSKSDYYWEFKNDKNARLYFRAGESEDDYETKFHGQEYQFVGLEELSTWDNLNLYKLLKTCLRCSVKHDNKNMPPLLMRATTNPYSETGSGWAEIENYFIENAKPGYIFDEKRSSKIHFFGLMDENEFLPAGYQYQFDDFEPKRRAAYRWGIPSARFGTMFSDVFDESVHYIETFKIPSNWYVDKTLDWGTSSPFSVLWFAESNGETFKDGNGKMISVPKGSLFVIYEWYGCKGPKELDKGLKMAAEDVSDNINKLERQVRQQFLSMNHKINIGCADTSIWADKNVVNGKCIARLLENKGKGTKWRPANKNKGSRVAGAEYIKSMLTAAYKNSKDRPHLYIFNNCKYLKKNLLELVEDPKNPGDIDTTKNDHDYDALRYRILQKDSKTYITNKRR